MPTTLSDWLAHIEALHPRGAAGIELGLSRVRQVKEALRQTQTCPLFLVGGTNGKGSTCAFLERILRCAGYRVGLYTSPHLLRYNERIRIAGRPIEDQALCRAFARVEAARRETGVMLTYFEFGTLAAWEAFSAASLDAILLEVGLGGRLDATNIYDADCSIITSIALDHTEYLGPTRAAIAREKAAIARQGRPLICGDPEPPPEIETTCRAIGADFWALGKAFAYTLGDGQWRYEDRQGCRYAGLPIPALRGAYQLANASCALAALSALRERLPVTAQDVRRGLLETILPGRFQVLPGRPQIILDVAHNPQAAAALAANLDAMAPASRTIAVFGVMVDKDLAGIFAALAPKITRWHFSTLPGPRGADASLLARHLPERASQATLHAGPEAALAAAREEAGADDRIVVFGSFQMVAAALAALGRRADE